MDKNSVKKIVDEYLEYLKKNNINYEKAYLFGSYAKDTANDNSDIDIALIFKSVKNKHKLLLKLMKLRRAIDLRIEPHPIEFNNFNFNDPFASEIAKYGLEMN